MDGAVKGQIALKFAIHTWHTHKFTGASSCITLHGARFIVHATLCTLHCVNTSTLMCCHICHPCLEVTL